MITVCQECGQSRPVSGEKYCRECRKELLQTWRDQHRDDYKFRRIFPESLGRKVKVPMALDGRAAQEDDDDDDD